jgi:hypothetical protein
MTSLQHSCFASGLFLLAFAGGEGDEALTFR